MFRDCVQKHMSEDDTKLMNELIEDHKYGRETVADLVDAKEKYLQGMDTLKIIVEKLNALTDFYPKHIAKEDKIFFPKMEKYFKEEELQNMLNEFWEFDKAMIHFKYKLVVENLLGK
jgi:hemerythrin-like domain-containing protein